MREALNDYKNKTGKAFAHLGAWEIVKKEAKWLESPLVGQTSSSHSDKRRKSSEAGNYETETTLPDLNEETTPSRPRKGKKSGAGEASSKSSVVENMEAYTAKKAQAVDEVSKKTQALLDIQIAQASQKAMRGDYKFFNQPHDHITDPIMLQWMLEQKRAIAAKYGWRCDF